MVYPSPFTRVFSSLLICHLILTSNLPKTLPNRRQNSKLVQVYWHWPSKTAQYASTFVFIRLRLAHLQNTPNPVEALSLWHWESRYKQEFLWNPAHSYTWRTPVIWPLQNSTTLSVTPGHFWHWRPAFLFAYTKFTTCPISAPPKPGRRRPNSPGRPLSSLAISKPHGSQLPI